MQKQVTVGYHINQLRRPVLSDNMPSQDLRPQAVSTDRQGCSALAHAAEARARGDAAPIRREDIAEDSLDDWRWQCRDGIRAGSIMAAAGRPCAQHSGHGKTTELAKPARGMHD